MKSTIRNQEQTKELTYPCLMESNRTGNVVLFYKESYGTVVFLGTGNNGDYTIGEQNDFEMCYFKPFNGSIELSN